MTDYLTETPTLSRPYCPGCEPDADPSLEILEARWCDAHSPTREGADDALVTSEAFLSGSVEAGGADNRLWCAVIHGESRGASPASRRRSRTGRRSPP